MNSNKIFLKINKKLTGGSCPKPGCLGECAAIFFIAELKSGRNLYEAHIYLWKDEFQDWGQIAKWFLDVGAEDVQVAWIMRDTADEVNDGRREDGTRHIIVSYHMNENCILKEGAK